jgi:hypothetical protein
MLAKPVGTGDLATAHANRDLERAGQSVRESRIRTRRRRSPAPLIDLVSRAIRPRSASLEAAGRGPGGLSATTGRRSNIAPARSPTLGRLWGRTSKCRPRRSALLLDRLLGARRAARRLSRLGRAGAGLAGGHRGLVAGHRRLRGTLPGLHRSFLNGAFGNRRQACPLSLRPNRKFSLAMPPRPRAKVRSSVSAHGVRAETKLQTHYKGRHRRGTNPA